MDEETAQPEVIWQETGPAVRFGDPERAKLERHPDPDFLELSTWDGDGGYWIPMVLNRAAVVRLNSATSLWLDRP